MQKKASATLTSRAGRWILTSEAPDNKSDDNTSNIQDTSTPVTLTRHPNFFFDNVLVAIQIENTLFNVHKYQLSKSEVFSDMFNKPKPEGHKPEEGSSPEHPIVIEGIATSEFAALLTVLYASHFTNNQPTPEAALVIPAFRLANLFKFSELRTYLLPLAEEKLDDVDKVVFAREFGIKEWLAPAHARICKREAVLSTEEANKLGVNSVLLIWRIREQYRTQGTAVAPAKFYCSNCINLTGSYSGICGHCKSSTSLRQCSGNATGTKININDSAIEADIAQWVEDGCTLKD